MSFDWTEFLDLAQALASQERKPATEEAKLRSAISRAYYAAYCTARNRLGAISFHVRDKHTYVWNHFQNSTDDALKEIGKNGHRLRKDRNKADYDNFISNLPYLTSADLILSNTILLHLSKLQ